MKHGDDCFNTFRIHFQFQFMRDTHANTGHMNKENKYCIAFSKFLNTCLSVSLTTFGNKRVENHEYGAAGHWWFCVGPVIYNNFQSSE